jgi:prephenate dehydrogenase/chorismate mutase
VSSVINPKIKSTPSDLEGYRNQIDLIDQQLVRLLEQRAQIVFAVGQYKRENNLPAHDPEREAKIKNRVRLLTSQSSPMTPDEMESVFGKLVESFRLMEKAHMQKQKAFNLFQEAHIDFNKPQQVVLWGFGLLGSSFYLALQKAVPHWNFLIVDPQLDVDLFMSWKEQHRLTNIDLINSQQMNQADIYVLGAAVEINAKHLQQFSFPKNSLVIDFGSTKEIMAQAFQKRAKNSLTHFHYVGGHPLAGKESSGFQNGDPLLFYNKVFCWIQPSTQQTNKKIKATCEILALGLGAIPYWTSAEEHDAALAWTSHLPQLLSSTLATCLTDKKFSQTAELFPGVISDLLRISGSSFSMWQSIFSSNQGKLIEALGELIQHLQLVQKNLSNTKACEKLFQDSNQFFKIFQELKNKKGA